MTSEVHLVTQRTSMDQYEAFFGSMNLGRSNWLGKLGFPGLSEWVYWPKNNGSVVERFVHIEDVGGSNPSSPTIFSLSVSGLLDPSQVLRNALWFSEPRVGT